MSEQVSQTKPRHVRIERGIYERSTESGRVFEYCYQDSDGDTRWATVKTLAQARKQRAAKIAAVDRGEQVLPRSKITFAELAEEWFEMKSPRLRPRTRDAYRAALDLVLLPRFGKVRVNIDADAIAKLTRDLEREGLHAIDPARPVRPLGRSSVENYLLPLQGVLKLAARRRLIASNPFDVLTSDDRPQREEEEPPHEWQDGEVEALLAASAALAAKPEARYDYTELQQTTATLGLRIGETLGLRWEDFNKDTSFMQVCRQWTRKGVYGPTKTPKGVRTLPVPPELRDALIALRLRSKFSKDSDPIFASRTGTPLSHRNVTRRGFEPAAEAAGLHDVTFHDLRDYAASKLISVGLDPVTVADFLGHEDASITFRRYAHLFNRQLKAEAIRAALSAKPVQSGQPSPPVDKASEEAGKTAQLRGLSTGGD